MEDLRFWVSISLLITETTAPLTKAAVPRSPGPGCARPDPQEHKGNFKGIQQLRAIGKNNYRSSSPFSFFFLTLSLLQAPDERTNPLPAPSKALQQHPCTRMGDYPWRTHAAHLAASTRHGAQGDGKPTQPPHKHWRSLHSSPQKMPCARGRAPHADLLEGCKMGCPGSPHPSGAAGPVVGHKEHLFSWDFCCSS